MEIVIVVLTLLLALSVITNWIYSNLYKGMKEFTDMQDEYINKLIGEITDYKKQFGDVTVENTESKVIEIKNYKH